MVGSTLGTAGCLGVGSTDTEQGTIVSGETERRPIRDGSLPEIDRSWPTAHFDARNTGYNQVLSSVLPERPQVRWHRQLAEEEDVLRGPRASVTARCS